MILRSPQLLKKFNLWRFRRVNAKVANLRKWRKKFAFFPIKVGDNEARFLEYVWVRYPDAYSIYSFGFYHIFRYDNENRETLTLEQYQEKILGYLKGNNND